MVDELPGITLKAVGVVRNTVKQAPGHGYNWQDVVSEIVVDSSLTEALDGLEKYSHIIVIWWMHKVTVTDQSPTKIHPQGNLEIPLTGIFATRSPRRPNPLGKATVRLLQRQGNILKVKGLDAIDGTPVIDIKPYIPRYDSVTGARAPEWRTSQ